MATNEGRLSDTERNFVYHLEVLGLSTKRAADICGVSSPYDLMKQPRIVEALGALRESTRQRVNITKDDVLNGIQSAVQDAKLICDPMAQIAGWREISKMLGYDAPKQVVYTLTGPLAEQRRELEQLPDAALAQLVDDHVIDADFYEIKKPN